MIFLGSMAIALMVLCIIVRGITETKLSSKRASLMKLRTQDRFVSGGNDSAFSTQSQLREAVGRVEGTQSSIEQLLTSIQSDLGVLYEHIHQEELPIPEYEFGNQKMDISTEGGEEERKLDDHEECSEEERP